MHEFPGQLTPDEQQEWIDRFRKQAEEQWGGLRAGEISEALKETALAAGAVLKLEFVRDEPPGFYLRAHFDETVDEWKIG
jgi:hypothetical protein